MTKYVFGIDLGSPRATIVWRNEDKRGSRGKSGEDTSGTPSDNKQ